MIKTQRQLQQEIFKKKEALSDEEIFFSPAYAEMLQNMQKGIVSTREDGKIYVEKANPSMVAYTDGEEVHVNLNFNLLKGLSSNVDKHQFLLGVTLHEFGHKLFTDFKLAKRSRDELESGMLYPMPRGNQYLEETLKGLSSGICTMTTQLIKIYPSMLRSLYAVLVPHLR